MARPARVGEASEVIYDEKHWLILEELRKTAVTIMKAMSGLGPNPIVHGSVARGDVDEKSDVDVFIPDQLPSYRVELALQKAGLQVWKRELVMATPWQLPKAHIYIDEKISVTFPLVKPRRLEIEFYHFGGAVDLAGLEKDTRVPGVDKRLMLIEPTQAGHFESQIAGRAAEAAKAVGVSLDIVRERVQVLKRRAEVGRTGVFIQRSLAPEESFEEVFKRLAEENPDVKLRLKKTRNG
ncbi:MAG: nucleotidyltransferase domain-containing protein [Candidatus Hadarchaeota archaeon]